jgi:hypothetical protein
MRTPVFPLRGMACLDGQPMSWRGGRGSGYKFVMVMGIDRERVCGVGLSGCGALRVWGMVAVDGFICTST